MEQPKEKHIDIQPFGSFFEVDSEGYLINPASFEKIQERWKPVIEAYVDVCKELYGDDLISIYLRGSVAKGQAIDNISDLDAFVVLQDNHKEPPKEMENEKEKELRKIFPFVNSFEFGIFTNTGIQDESLLLNQSLCLYGQPIQVPRVKLSKELVWHAPNFESRHQKLLDFFMEENPNSQRVRGRIEWFGKGVLRTGLEILIEKSGKYSRDLYPCYKIFSEFYPEKEKEMRAVLDLVLNPNTTQEKARGILVPISEFILEEAKKIFPKK